MGLLDSKNYMARRSFGFTPAANNNTNDDLLYYRSGLRLHITPEICRAAYDYLRSTPPFKRWKLPPGEEVAFIITNQQKATGQEQTVACVDHDKEGDFRIQVSLWNDATDLLMMTLAHEMCHMRQAQLKGFTSSPYGHKRDFQKLADLVCKNHRFNRNYF